jgi:hypothetical protein
MLAALDEVAALVENVMIVNRLKGVAVGNVGAVTVM